MRIDDTNQQLLLLLQKNGRSTWAELAQAVGRSESTVRERVAALEMEGILQGYHATIDWSRAGLPASAVLHGQCELSKVAELTDRLTEIPNVTSAVLTTGSRPILCHLQVRDAHHLQELLKSIADCGLRAPEMEIVLQPLVHARPPGFSPEPAEMGPRELAH
ncbi:MAG: Lrp/AsnC family transcriptional regulator [Thermoplasmatota archaeon]